MKMNTTKVDTTSGPLKTNNGDAELKAAILDAFEQSATMRATDEGLRAILADLVIVKIRAAVREAGPGLSYWWFHGR